MIGNHSVLLQLAMPWLTAVASRVAAIHQRYDSAAPRISTYAERTQKLQNQES